MFYIKYAIPKEDYRNAITSVKVISSCKRKQAFYSNGHLRIQIMKLWNSERNAADLLQRSSCES